MLESFYVVRFMILFDRFIGFQFFHFAFVALTEGEGWKGALEGGGCPSIKGTIEDIKNSTEFSLILFHQ